MSLINFAVIGILIAIGGGFIAFLGYFALTPLLSLVKSSKSMASQSKKRQGLEEFISLIESENFNGALSVLTKVPFLDSPSSTEHFLFVRNHNQDFVTQCFFLFEKLSWSTTDIANLEMLFNERFELFSHLFKAQVNKKVLQEKHETDKKKLPSWAKDEFSNKEKEINISLSKNLKEIELLLSQLSAGILSESSTNMTIH
jgi:hypothetical protein